MTSPNKGLFCRLLSLVEFLESIIMGAPELENFRAPVPVECDIYADIDGLTLRIGIVFDRGCVGRGGTSSVEDALICATRFLTEAFLPFKPGVLRGNSSSLLGYRLGSSADQSVEWFPLLPPPECG